MARDRDSERKMSRRGIPYGNGRQGDMEIYGDVKEGERWGECEQERERERADERGGEREKHKSDKCTLNIV